MTIPQGLLKSLQSVPAALAWYDGARGIGFRTLGWSQRVQAGTEQVTLHSTGHSALLDAKSADGKEVSLQLRTTPTGSGAWLQLDDDGIPRDGAMESLQARVAELERHAYRDSLTGLWNRRYFDTTITGETSRADRHRQPLSLLVIDVDHFKQVNDSRGHAVGDQVLQAVAAILQKRCRNSDLLMRWGGDEFAVLATFCSWRSVRVLANYLRRMVAATELTEGVQLTLSIGAGQYLPGEAVQTWFQRVDAQLYAAKNAGRNAVCTDESSPPVVDAGVVQLLWRDDYRCGNATLDDQHEALVHLANSVLQVMMPAHGTPPDASSALPALDALLGHVVQHFADEEAIISAAGYPRARQHALVHSHLVAKALQLRNDLEAGHDRLGELVNFLARDVVVRHIASADAEFFPWLKQPPDAAVSESNWLGLT